MTDAIAIRKRVAELCGFTDIKVVEIETKSTSTSIVVKPTEIWGLPSHGFAQVIPHYDTSLDAITQTFDDHGKRYRLQKDIEDGITYYFASKEPAFYTADTAAMALCKLFIDLMESPMTMANNR